MNRAKYITFASLYTPVHTTEQWKQEYKKRQQQTHLSVLGVFKAQNPK